MNNKLNLLFCAVLMAGAVNAQDTEATPLPEVAPVTTAARKGTTNQTNRKSPVDGPEKFAAQEAAVSAVPGSDSIIPNVVNGDFVRTRIQFTNVDTYSTTLTISFADHAGYGTRYDIDGVGYVNTIKGTLAGKASYEVVTSGAGDFTPGWAIFTTVGGRVIAQTTIEQLDANGVWQDSTTPAANFFANRVSFRFDHRRGWDTQYVLLNCNPYSSATVTMTVRNTTGVIVQTEHYSMGSLHAGAINSLRNTLLANWTSGTVEFSVATGLRGGIAAVAVRFNDSGAFETVAPQTVTGWVN